MISIPSPPHAASASAPDVLSSILESQTLLHSKRSIVSVTVDGQVNIKLNKPRTEPNRPRTEPNRPESSRTGGSDRVDVTKGTDAAKKVPSYPGGGSGGRGWGGGYRGNYHRDHNTQLNRGGHDGYGYPGPGRPGGYNNGTGRDEPFNSYRHSHAQPHDDYSPRRPPRWPRPPPPNRHSFGGFENPLDMRVGTQGPEPQRQSFGPLPEPPVFKFDKTPEMDKSEDEKSDPGLIIDTEKYDPMEPTRDDSPPPAIPSPPAPPPPPLALPSPPAPPLLALPSPPAPPLLPLPSPPIPPPLSLPSPPAPPALLQGVLEPGGISSSMLDCAVRQVKPN